MVAVVQTFGDQLNLHPHVQTLVARGGFRGGLALLRARVNLPILDGGLLKVGETVVRGRRVREPRRRWNPPPVTFESELIWLFGAVFAAEPPRAGAKLRRARIVELARAFDLAPRLVGRLGRRRVVEELGEGPGWSIVLRALEVSERGEARLAAVHDLDRLASAAGFQIVFLKYAALVLGGYTHPSLRGASDLDVLADESDLERLARALAVEGWASSGLEGAEHHMPQLLHVTHGKLELHHRLPGIGLKAGERSARLRDLHEGEHLVPAPGLSSVSTIPSRAILVAYALAHGLAQHGDAPWTYPMLRVLADLQDLGTTEDEVREGTRIAGWLSECLSPGDVCTAARLVRRLEAGDASLFEASQSESAEGVLMRHLVAGALDPVYAESLRFASLTNITTERRHYHALARIALSQLYLSAANLEKIYGPGRHPLRLLALRLYRPIDLFVRALRYGATVARLRLGIIRRLRSK